jgi:hypothetical protein
VALTAGSIYKKVAYGNGTYVVVGATSGGNAAVSTSTTGTSGWTQRTPVASGEFNSVAFGNGVFVAVGSGGIVQTSPDGITWTTRPFGYTGTLFDVIFHNGLFIACGNQAANTAHLIRTSPDGITWTTRYDPGTGNSLYAIAVGNGSISIVDQGAGILSSFDGGLTWSNQGVTGLGFNCYGLASSGDQYVVGGGGNALLGSSSNPSTILAISGCQTDGFEAGWLVESDPGAAASGTILSLDNTQVVVTPPDTNWAIGQKIKTKTSGYSQIVPPPGNPNTSDLVSLFIPIANLTVSTKYYARVQFTSGTAGPGVATTSPWSTWASFGTASSFALVPGTPMAGGYFGGYISTAGNGVADYALIVAPVSSGGLNGQYPGTSSYKPGGNSPDLPAAVSQNEVYGVPATTAFADGAHPILDWCISNGGGPNAGTYDPTNATLSGIGGYNDWYIPAKNELAILYFFLKPDGTANNTGSGSNANSVSPYTLNTTYGAGYPNQTSADGTSGTVDFRTPAAQAFGTTSRYWTATEGPATNGNWAQDFGTGNQLVNSKTSTTNTARAIRRIPV